MTDRPAERSTRRRGGPPEEHPVRVPSAVGRTVPAAAAWTGFTAAAVGAFVAVVVAVAFWIPDAGASGSSGSVVHAGLLTYLASVHGGLVLDGVAIGYVPLGLTLLAGWLCWRSAAVLCALPVTRSIDSLAGWSRALAVHAVGFAVTAGVLTVVGRVGTSRVPVLGAVTAAFIVSVLFSGAAILRHSDAGGLLAERLPSGWLEVFRAAAAALGVLLAGAAVLTVLTTLLHAGRVLAFQRGLGTGASGLPVAALSLASVPNMVIAALTYLTGVGFSVGAGSHYSVLAHAPGVVPALPPLAVLPGGSPSIVVLVLGAVTVLAAGVALGWRCTAGPLLVSLGRAVAAAVGVGLVTLVLAWQGGGSLGRSRLSVVGASPWRMGGSVFAELAVVAVVTVLIAALVARFSARPAASGASAGLTVLHGGRQSVPVPATGDEAETTPLPDLAGLDATEAADEDDSRSAAS